MRVSLNWVKRLLQVDELGVSPETLQDRLTMHLTEIDAVEAVGPQWPQVVVGEVLRCEQHPNADRLAVTEVAVGADAPIPVVCGAPNVAAGQRVAVALPGAELSIPGKDATQQQLTIKKGKLRGEASHGMICAEDELGLGDDHDGILVLETDAAPGTPLGAVLGGGDHVLVVDNHNINHRPDLWGQRGWAREIAAILGLPPPADADLSWRESGAGMSVRIDDPRCLCYRGALVGGVHNGPSPAWMRELLEAVDMRPLGLLVDVTNFVMAELGEPMHAFDRRRLHGERIVVRGARPEERLELLDGSELALDPDDLLITDDEQALALAGIMGGAASGVAADTDTIVLEAAVFERGAIRRARMRHGTATDSSSRFEKGLFPELTAAAINRSMELLRAECPDCVLRCSFADAASDGHETHGRRIVYPSADYARHIGVELSAERQHQHLRALGLRVDDDAVAIPWWRQKDLTEAIDLVEEVARLEGYAEIAAELPRMPIDAPQTDALRQAEHRLRRRLSGCGWDEIASYCLCSDDWAELLAWPRDERIRLVHPLSSTQTVLRMSLLPTLLESLGRNRRYLDELRCYELGKVYSRGRGHAPSTDEEAVLAGVCTAEESTSPFYAAREAAVQALAALGYPVELQALAHDDPELIEGRAAELRIGTQSYAQVGEVPAMLREHAGCQTRVGYFRIALERLLREHPVTRAVQHRPPSRFQLVTRDFTFVCPESLSFAELAQASRRAAGDLLRDVDLAQEIFRDAQQLGAEQKAVSVRLSLQSDERTLSDKELRKLEERVVKVVENTTPAKLRR